MSADNAPEIISFSNCLLPSPTAKRLIFFLSVVFEIISPISDFRIISFPICSCVIRFFFCNSSSKRCENGPCPISWSSAANLTSLISENGICPFDEREFALIPAICITPSECSNLVCCAPGYVR